MALKLSKTSILLTAAIAFSSCTPAMALTDKAPVRSDDSVDSEAKVKQRKPAEVPPARKPQRCNTCRILM